MYELLPEGWILTSWITKDELARVSARLGIEDAYVVLTDVRVRPVKLSTAVHRGPIKDTISKFFSLLPVHA